MFPNIGDLAKDAAAMRGMGEHATESLARIADVLAAWAKSQEWQCPYVFPFGGEPGKAAQQCELYAGHRGNHL